MPKRICHKRKTSLSPSSQISSSIMSFRDSQPKQILEKGNSLEIKEDRNDEDKKINSELPEHLRNFKEFHSLRPPFPSKLTVLNRRIKRQSR